MIDLSEVSIEPTLVTEIVTCESSYTLQRTPTIHVIL